MSDPAIGTGAAVPPALARLAEVCGVGVVLLSAARVPTFANATARRLLELPDTDDVPAHSSHVEVVLARALPPNATESRLPVTTQISIGDRDVQVESYALDDGSADRLVIVQEATGGAAATRRHAARDHDLAWLARDLAHELKGVLNLIVVNLALLSNVTASDDTNPEGETTLRYASIIRRQVGRLDDTLSLLLDRTVLSRGTLERFELGQCCRLAAQLAGPRASRQGTTVEVDVPSASAMVEGYEDRMAVAVLNLVVHALQAMPADGRVQLAVCAPQDGRVRMLVTSTGPGLRPDTTHAITGPPERTVSVGPGFGLRSARETIEAHGGRLGHEEGPAGLGTRFTIDLPAAAPLRTA